MATTNGGESLTVAVRRRTWRAADCPACGAKEAADRSPESAGESDTKSHISSHISAPEGAGDADRC